MKKWLPLLSALLALSACTLKKPGTAAPAAVTAAMPDRQLFVFVTETPDGSLRRDTLFVVKMEEEPRFAILWKKDTVAQEWSYDKSVNFISSLGPAGVDNTFLMRVHMGDGCPFVYKILAIRDNGTCYCSDTFGNCNEVSGITVTWPQVRFDFEAMEEANRHKISVVYNCTEHALKQL